MPSMEANPAAEHYGAPVEALSLDVFSLIGGRCSFAGSMIGGIGLTQETLDFCTEHWLGADPDIDRSESSGGGRCEAERPGCVTRRWAGQN